MLFANSGLKILENLKKAGLNSEVGATPFEVVEKAGSVQLLRYSQNADGRPPLLIIPSLINRFYILDLLPEKSLIAYLSKFFSVYLIEWGEARPEDKNTSLNKLIELHFDFLYQALLRDAQAAKAHLVGHCLGGNVGLIWSLLHPQKVASLSFLTTPLDFDVPGTVQAWAQNKDFDVASLIEAYGNAPWALLQTAFLGLKPLATVQKVRKILPRLNDARSTRNFLALESWSADNRSVRGACYRDVIEVFYRQNCFIKEGYSFRGRRYALKDLTCPVSAISSLDDHIVAFESTLKPEMVPQAATVKTWQAAGGHIGSVLGQQAQNEIWPEFVNWLRDQEKKHERHSTVTAI